MPITSEIIAASARADALANIPSELIDYEPEAYRIGPGDALFITVWDHPELTIPGGSQTDPAANARFVSEEGTIFYPFIGKIRAAGLKPDQLRQALTSKLSRLIDQPQIDVNVLEYNSQKITLTGAFSNPGYLPLTASPLSLLEAVSAAGINEDKADSSKLLLIRDGVTYTLNYAGLINKLTPVDEIYLRAGDRLHLQSADQAKVYIAGEVDAPHALPYTGTAMMLSAVLESLDASFTSSFRSRDLYVIRDDKSRSSEKRVFQLDAQQPNAYMLADRFPLMPEDVVYVGAAKIDNWANVLSQLFPGAHSTEGAEQVSHLD